jgi:hypothetical protein
VLCGLLTQIVVANCNALAAVLLLRTAAKVGQSSYESVAEAVGGPIWRVITQVTCSVTIYVRQSSNRIPIGGNARPPKKELKTFFFFEFILDHKLINVGIYWATGFILSTLELMICFFKMQAKEHLKYNQAKKKPVQSL